MANECRIELFRRCRYQGFDAYSAARLFRRAKDAVAL